VILPFEKEFYLKSGMDVEYVGHPLLDSITLGVDKSKAIQDMGLTDGCPIVGLLPGSRSDEVRNLLPLMVKAVEILSSHYPNIRCVLAMAPTLSADLVESLISQSTIEITISRENIYKTLRACDLALVTSGTATLETAIMEVPMVIVYRVSLISYWVGKMVIKVPYIGLVNLVAGEQVVPELIQDEVTPQRLSDEAVAILESDQRKEDMRRKLQIVRERLGRGGASERTAGIAIEMITKTGSNLV
jgi:lipid-A-disaccharide synthase